MEGMKFKAQAATALVLGLLLASAMVTAEVATAEPAGGTRFCCCLPPCKLTKKCISKQGRIQERGTGG